MAIINLKKETWESDLPFKVKLSFKRVFDYWEERAASPKKGKALYAQEVLDSVKHAKELRKGIDNVETVEKYEMEIRKLLSPIFPSLLSLNEIKAVSIPFTPLFFNASKRFENIMKSAGADYDVEFRGFDKDSMYIIACTTLLRAMYDISIDNKRPLYLDIPNKEKGTMHHYRLFTNADFSDISPIDPKFSLSPEDIKLLMNNANDVALWKKLIPPHSFCFEGFGLVTLLDLTYDQIVSQLKSDLLEKDALLSSTKLDSIEVRLRTIFNIPNLKFGFSFINEDDGKINTLGQIGSRSLILEENEEVNISELFCDDSREMCIRGNHPFVISNLEEAANRPQFPLYQKLMEKGIYSYIAIPIKNGEKTIGILELGAPEINQLNNLITNKLVEIIPIFAIALQRSWYEYETKLEAIIQEKCTAIHPTVNWRFFEAAENMLKTQALIDTDEMEEIVFDNVYPLYGQSDIKGSSTARNKGIQEDLVEQLTLAKSVLQKAAKKQRMPVFNQLNYRINAFINSMKKGLSAGDETNILDFLKTDVYPVFNHLKSIDTGMAKAVENYASKLDPVLGVIYKKRKDYENSVSMINEKISTYLEKQQDEAQEMFPHYFEKYKTDGVEYNIYIGESLNKNRAFDPMYLHNLRLWQLITTCGVENVMHNLKPNLKVPLDVASLILVHSTPLAIKFRMDEKQFDVDGAYNVRYAIVKKRIDKAYIKGTTERLTQPKKIAIVYSQDKDAREYIKYLEYMQSLGLIGPTIENVELEELQGASGLKALRVDVIYKDATTPADATINRLVKEVKNK